MISKTMKWIFGHPVTSLIILVVVGGGGYYYMQQQGSTATETRYVLGAVTRGTIVSSVSGTGQVSAKNQVDIKSQASGPLVSLNAAIGQSVESGQLIGRVDARDALAQLQNAKLSYQNLVTIDPATLRSKTTTVDTAKTNLDTAYQSARTAVASAVIDMGAVKTGLDDIYTGYLSPSNAYQLSALSKSYVDPARSAYVNAKGAYTDFTAHYRVASADSSTAMTDTLLQDAQTTAVQIAEAAKTTQDALQYLEPRDTANQSAVDAALSSANNLVTQANSIVTDVQGAATTIANDVRSLSNAEADLADLKAGPTTLDINSSQLSIDQKQQAYDNYFVRAPFAGILASVDVSKGDTVSNGTTIATLITKEKVAEISLNEIDAAKVSIGDKATLTFDALPDLTLTGEVLSVDLVGTVSQGVVSYTVQIGFDTDDDRVKPGMTVTADIVTNVAQNVLTISSSAIRTQGSASVVDVVNASDASTSANGGSSNGGVLLATPPTPTEVQTGLSNDTMTEITGGLKEGQQYVIRSTTQAATTQTNSSAPSLFGGRGFRG